jgi:hypothetical protein
MLNSKYIVWCAIILKKSFSKVFPFIKSLNGKKSSAFSIPEDRKALLYTKIRAPEDLDLEWGGFVNGIFRKKY